MEPLYNARSDSIENEDTSSIQSTPSPTPELQDPAPLSSEEIPDTHGEDFNAIDIDALIAEADRKLAAMKSDPNCLDKISSILEPTKYSKAVTKISKFDSKLRALSMRDKALKRHSKSVKALLEAGKLEEAEDLALQMPGNDLLDEECTDLDGGIFYQTELISKPELRLPPIITQGPLNLVKKQASPEKIKVNPPCELIPLSECEIERLEALLEKDIIPENQVLLSEDDVSRMEEINSKLELLGPDSEFSDDAPVYEQERSGLEDIMSRLELSEQFVSASKRKDLERIDTALDLLKSRASEGELAPSEKIEYLLSRISSNVST